MKENLLRETELNFVIVYFAVPFRGVMLEYLFIIEFGLSPYAISKLFILVKLSC